MRAANAAIREGHDLSLRETSRALKWLATHGYAVCLNPSNKQGVKGIQYERTKLGNMIAAALR
jgi:hypothetical protein